MMVMGFTSELKVSSCLPWKAKKVVLDRYLVKYISELKNYQEYLEGWCSGLWLSYAQEHL